jgi:hypothetical protein
MKLNIDAKIELRDKNGKRVKTIRKTLKSYVRGIIDQLYANAVLDTYTRFCMQSSAGDSLFGVQVGIGETAVTISDSALETLILHGDTSGKLNYGSTSIGSVAIVGSTAKFTIARTLTNNSGADINVKEVGLRIKDTYTDTYVFIERTLLPFTIVNGTSGTVTYTISVTV